MAVAAKAPLADLRPVASVHVCRTDAASAVVVVLALLWLRPSGAALTVTPTTTPTTVPTAVPTAVPGEPVGAALINFCNLKLQVLSGIGASRDLIPWTYGREDKKLPIMVMGQHAAFAARIYLTHRPHRHDGGFASEQDLHRAVCSNLTAANLRDFCPLFDRPCKDGQ